jgi:hypothetical protein
MVRHGSAPVRALEWMVLDWNETAMGFYRRLGAKVLTDPLRRWSGHRRERWSNLRPGLCRL